MTHQEFAIIGETDWNCAEGEMTFTYGSTILGDLEFANKCLADTIAKNPEGWRNLRLKEITRHHKDATPEKAAELSAQTGLPVEYSYHTGITLQRGVLARVNLEASPEAIHKAWDEMGQSSHNLPDRSSGSTGGSWFDEED